MSVRYFLPQHLVVLSWWDHKAVSNTGWVVEIILHQLLDRCFVVLGRCTVVGICQIAFCRCEYARRHHGNGSGEDGDMEGFYRLHFGNIGLLSSSAQISLPFVPKKK